MKYSIERDFGEEVTNLFYRFINDLDEKMYYAMQKEGDVYLQAPQFLIDILFYSFRITFNRAPEKNTSGFYFFQGMEIHPTYEMAIILFHKDYPIYREKWMLKKISLEPTQTISEQWYSKTIFKLKEFNGLDGQNPADN